MEMIRDIAHKLGIRNVKENLDLFTKQTLKGNYYWTGYPMAIQIDTTNKCGPKHSGIFCEYCMPQDEVLSGRSKHQDMPMEWIEWIQRDMDKNMPNLLDENFPPKQQVCYFLNGDWQNESRSEEILRNHGKILSWLPSQVFTCATKPEEAWRFCNRNLNWVCVTLSAPNREVYKRVHGGDKFDNVIASMKYIENNSYPNQHLEVHFVITQHNINFMKEWYDFIGTNFPRWNRVMSPLVKSEFNLRSVASMGELTLEIQEQAIAEIKPSARFWNHTLTPLKQPCVLWNNAAVTCEGEVLQCCNWDVAGKWNYGYIQDYIKEGRSLVDYWMERLANKQRNSLCRACNLKHPEYKQRIDNIKVKVRVLA